MFLYGCFQVASSESEPVNTPPPRKVVENPREVPVVPTVMGPSGEPQKKKGTAFYK